MAAAVVRDWVPRAVAWNDLLLEGKHVTRRGIDQHLHPVHVVDAVFLVVAERLQAGEVFQARSGRVEKGLVDTEVVRVTVDVDDRPPEVSHVVAQSAQEIMEAVWLAVRLDERLRVAHRGARRVGRVEARIGL